MSILKIVLGVLLLLLAVRHWRGRPRGPGEPHLPSWMRTIDTFTPVRSLAMGVALSAINPKNLLLVVGAAAAIAQTGADTAEQAVALAVFILIGTLGVGAPGGDLLRCMGDRARQILGGLRAGWPAKTPRSWPSSAWSSAPS